MVCCKSHQISQCLVTEEEEGELLRGEEDSDEASDMRWRGMAAPWLRMAEGRQEDVGFISGGSGHEAQSGGGGGGGEGRQPEGVLSSTGIRADERLGPGRGRGLSVVSPCYQ